MKLAVEKNHPIKKQRHCYANISHSEIGEHSSFFILYTLFTGNEHRHGAKYGVELQLVKSEHSHESNLKTTINFLNNWAKIVLNEKEHIWNNTKVCRK